MTQATKKKPKPADENDRLKAGTLPLDPLEGCAPIAPPAAAAKASSGAPAPAVDRAAELELARQVLDGLAERAKGDAGAAFVPEVLDALALLKAEASAEWQRVRDDLKRAGVRVRELDDQLKKRARAAAAAEVKASAGGGELVRSVVSAGTGAGWFVATRRGWIAHRFAEARALAAAYSGEDEDPAAILGAAVEDPWELVNRPFRPEYPEGEEARLWNRDAAQLAFEPAPGKHPTWDLVLDRAGCGLDYAVAHDPWCQANGVRTGGDYLRLWAAALLQDPLEPLPFLFFYGPQNTGKSSFHEALSTLMTRGYVDAKTALTSPGTFTGELAGALLCYADEIDLRSNKGAHTKIKEWVTARQLLIHTKGRTPYPQVNSTHWVQTANELDHCPILPGDTRITAIAVAPLEEGEEIPKRELMRRLRAEAPAFLHTAVSLQLPGAPGRLRVPVIETGEKREAMRANRTELEVFLDENEDWLALTPEEVAKAFHAVIGGRAQFWPQSKVARKLLDRQADGPTGCRRRLALAIRRWFEAGGRMPRYQLAGKLLAQLEGEVATWTPQKAAKHAGAIVAALRAVGIVVTFQPVAAGTEWRLEPCRLDMRVVSGGVGGNVA